MNQRLRGNFLLGVCVGLVIAVGGVAITTSAQLTDEELEERRQDWRKLSAQERNELRRSIIAQGKRWDELSDEERQELMEWGAFIERMEAEEFLSRGIVPDTESPDWRYLSEDVGLIVHSREQGVNTARLFMRIEFQGQEQWVPLAIDDGKNKSSSEFMLVEP